VADPNASLGPNQFYEAFWQNAVTGSDQLRQRMRFALSQIFVISLVDPNIDIRGAASYYDMLGANALGNYRTLLEQVTLHPMMGVYLTHLANQKEDTAGTRSPDENYACEVMQLMSIGLFMLNPDGTKQLDTSGQPIPTYTQDDISGLARVFTGLSWYAPTPTNNTFFGGNRNADATIRPMIFYNNYHSTSQKRFLGTTIPSLAYVRCVATVFNNNGSGVRGDLAAVIRAVLTDSEARNIGVVSSASFGKLREPVIRLANWMRAFGATSQSGNWLMGSTSANTSLSQAPLTSPSVFNFWRPGYVPPSTQLGAQNLQAPEFQVVDEVTVAGYLNTMQNAVNAGVGSGNDIRSAYTAEIAIANDPVALVDRVNKLLVYGQLSAISQQRINEAVTGVAIPATGTQAQIDAARLNRAKLAVFLAMASPEYLALR